MRSRNDDLGLRPRHDPVDRRTPPSISQIRHRTGLVLLALLTAITMAIGYGMMRFVMWLGAILAEQLIPHHVDAPAIAATVALLLAALI